MKQITLFLLGILLLSACNDNNGGSNNPPKEYRHTTIIYMSAQNSLGYQNAATYDSTEIAEGATKLKNEDDNIIFYLDDAKYPRIYRLYRHRNGTSYIKKLKMYGTDLNSSDPHTLKEVLDYTADNFPSKSYGLVLWSHGTGWLPDFTSFDNSNPRKSAPRKPMGFSIDTGEGGTMFQDLDANHQLGQQMEIKDMAWAIESSKIHPRFILFDACLMQCIEVAYTLRHATDYIVASPCTTSGYGAYYVDMIPNGLFCYPYTEDSVKKIADTYYYDVMDNPRLQSFYKDQGCVFSVVKTAGLDNLANATNAFLSTAIRDGEYPDLTDVQQYQKFDQTLYPDFFDINSSMKKLLNEENYKRWKEALDACVIHTRTSDKFYFYGKGFVSYYNNVDKETACGMSMFFPQDSYNNRQYYGNLNELFKDTEWYQAAGWPKCGW